MLCRKLIYSEHYFYVHYSNGTINFLYPFFVYLLPLTTLFAVIVAGGMKLLENAFSCRCFLLLLHSELFEIAQEGAFVQDAADVTEEAVEIKFYMLGY